MAKEKDKRRSLILHIVSGEPIGSQKQLLDRLREHGVETTQATLSRDIRELGLVKVSSAGGGSRNGFRYLPGAAGAVGREISSPLAAGVVRSISAAENLLVIRTRPGFAQSVAASIDSLAWKNVLGTVGGDDTVLVVTAGPGQTAGIEERLSLFFMVDDNN